MKIEEYLSHDGLGLAEQVRTGAVTAAELLALARERTAQVNPALNAVVVRMDAEADARVAGPLDGPFAGVPFLLKDLGQEYAGRPSSAGNRALARVPAAQHATVVQRWLDAGLVVFGRTNTPEFGAKGVTEPDLYGPARNPWDTGRTPGGSSGGTASAVAAGIVPVAGASDGGGSIRIPAACCGLFGLKPSRGLVPSGPTNSEWLHGLATDGVISRSVRDSAAMLDVLAGPDPMSAVAATVPDGGFLAGLDRAPGRLRIAMQTSSALTPTPDPAAVQAVEQAAALLTELGHEVEPVSPFYDDAALAKHFLTIWFVNLAFTVEQVKQLTGCGNESFELDTLIVAGLGRTFSGLAHQEAIEARHGYIAALAGLFERYDLLLTPSLARPPLKVGELATPPALVAGAKAVLATRTTRLLPHLGMVDDLVQKNLGWVPFTQLANLTGRPAMSVPLYRTPQGLPLGVQLVAPLGADALLLQLARTLEQARPWADDRPPL
jgi:Asp-tRNA(Asn)/Glu-tRNA(Gln) amidotransferase A subunit family amidase